jgi:hypothetical protein
MEIWLFGNPDLNCDCLPLKILPQLKKLFPKIDFIIQDPLEEWSLPSELFIIDTVQGLKKVEVFTTLEKFQPSPHVTMHDFDLGAQLNWLKKLGVLPKFTIFGIPENISETAALNQLNSLLQQYEV